MTLGELLNHLQNKERATFFIAPKNGKGEEYRIEELWAFHQDMLERVVTRWWYDCEYKEFRCEIE